MGLRQPLCALHPAIMRRSKDARPLGGDSERIVGSSGWPSAPAVGSENIPAERAAMSLRKLRRVGWTACGSAFRRGPVSGDGLMRSSKSGQTEFWRVTTAGPTAIIHRSALHSLETSHRRDSGRQAGTDRQMLLYLPAFDRMRGPIVSWADPV